MKVVVLAALLAGLIRADFAEDYSFFKVDKVYGEETYVSKKQIKHYNPTLKAYHEVFDSGDGMELKWHHADKEGYYEKGYVNLRYGDFDEESLDSSVFGGSVLNRVLKLITLVMILLSVMTTCCLFSVLRKVKDIEHGQDSARGTPR